ncbi:metal-dependent phosphohydrolase [Sinorhizobium numidicum]|uniref:Metal-dependent phosphohydrolase n=1 Tax=Sinorhizobium numidicum TaxID=680248 RepID=A0ABY8CS13_9HYPH|nr:metal-dependent phosphohydrolase [Sinorhizobium numidicum]WEX73811.1 metal-dependent phosphohydrolase [Sinorhizobium numidicum]WEX79796.1 metal-dependent phosphohydrolase [Sinorhizobium numidicum]
MNSREALTRAIQIASVAHRDQTDKTGLPFIRHCERVAGGVEGDAGKTLAYLHDVVEKAPDWSLSRLAEEGFSAGIVAAVEAMTRREGEDDSGFVRRAASNQLARLVKRADLEDNLHQLQSVGGDASKYRRGLDILRDEFGCA